MEVILLEKMGKLGDIGDKAMLNLVSAATT